MYDVIIIGAGVTGCSVARSLSKYKLNVAVLEKELDVCEGTSKANSGIVHAGFDAEPDTLKARLNVQGNVKMGELAEELDFSFERNGSLVLCFSEEDRPGLEKLYESGQKNGVRGLKIITGEEARAMEPALSDNVVAALYAPTGGIVCPFGLTIALAENAFVNGVEFYFDHAVETIEPIAGGYRIVTGKGDFEARVVVNAAGVYADKLHHMVSREPMEIVARKGEYCLYDKQVGNYVSHTIFQLPTKYGKGVLVSPTVHGNLLLGPTATDIENKDGVNTTAEGLADVSKKAAMSLKALPAGRQMITSFAGLRAHEVNGDFIIGEAEDARGFFNVAGIESPGLTCAPVIGDYVTDLIRKSGLLEEEWFEIQKNYTPKRQGIRHLADLPEAEQKALIEENPSYAVVVCRCETVTEGEILDAIRRPLGAKTLDGIKRRTRAGMGRCQAGFCTPKTMELIAREWKMPVEEILKSGRGSHVL